jgi:hypothetical protein
MAGGASAARIDATNPGAIQSLTAVSAARAITLKFIAPGDDGRSGRAAGYDVYYSQGSSCTGIGTPPGPSWVLAPRSNETTAEISGAVDFFNVHAGEPGDGDGDGLAAGVQYCVAIRARDEVLNRGPWSFIDAPTLAGDWDLTPRFRLTGGTRATALNFAYPDPFGEAVLGWVVTDPSGPNARTLMQFESSPWGVRHDVAAAPISRIDWFRMIAIPDGPDGTGRVGAVFGGYSNTSPSINYHRVVEVGSDGHTVETAVSGTGGVGGIASPGGGFTYIQRGTAWNPVVAFERIVAKTVVKGNVTWSTRLAVTERVGGQWQAEQSTGISRTDSITAAFRGAQLFTKPDGTTLGLLVSHCGVLIYAERLANVGWTYWDAGPGTSSLNPGGLPGDLAEFAIGFSDDAVPAPIIARRSAYNGVLQITHPLTGAQQPELWTPTSTCANVVSRKPNAWEPVAMAADSDVPYIFVTAVAEVQGSVYVAMNAYHGAGKTADQRVVYRCAAPPSNPSSNWQVASIDRTNGQTGTAAVGPVVVNGSLRRAYGWNRASSNSVNPLDLPDDFVVLASQSVTSLCP